MSSNRNQDERREAVLEGALALFSQYGFKRTSMEDIARQASIPRTALYRLFRSKEHIFLELAELVHQTALDAAVMELASDGPFATRLKKALIARDTHLLAIGHSGPHGNEIAEIYLQLGADLVATYDGKLEQRLLKAVRDAVKAGAFQIPKTFDSAKHFVMLLRLSLEGIKKEVKTPKKFTVLAEQLIDSLCGVKG